VLSHRSVVSEGNDASVAKEDKPSFCINEMRILHAAETISTNVRCVMYQQESYQNRIIHILVSHYSSVT